MQVEPEISKRPPFAEIFTAVPATVVSLVFLIFIFESTAEITEESHEEELSDKDDTGEQVETQQEQ